MDFPNNFVEWCDTLKELNIISIFIRIVLSLLLGGIIGAERGIRNRPSVFMTYVLVCIGSTLIMLTNQYISVTFPGTDPTRLAAQVVSGIGFLGAGTIITTRNDEIRGLTTAAGLWVAAALGLAIGVGFYMGALIGCGFTVFTLIRLKKIDIYIKQHSKIMDIYLEYDTAFSLRKLSEFSDENKYEVFDMKRGKVKTFKEEIGTLSFSIGITRKKNHSDVLDGLYKIEGVQYVKEIT